MEKRCEFCMALRAVVLCSSDAAQLCLSCDAKVHSANALSYRHPRTLVCQSCTTHPALLRCPQRHIFVCRTCASHSRSHPNDTLASYVGCPSAQDLARLWGLQINQDHQTHTCFILQQILDLERLQLSQPQDPLSPPFPHLDTFTINADPFSQCHHNYDNQIWAQNMQDLGVCDQAGCFEDVNIPDLDLTFTSFEDLFGTDKDPTKFEQSDDIDEEIAISVSLFSGSRITCESSGSHCNDDELSRTFPEHDVDDAKSGGTENAVMRYKEKKVVRHEKQAQYTCPRSKSDFKKRGKSQVLKIEEGDCGSVTRSF